MTLPLGQVVPLDKTGVDGPADRRVGPTCCHGFRGPEDHPCAHCHHAPAHALFDTLGVSQTGRWPPRWCGIGASAPLAWRVRPCPVGVQQGVAVGGQWIAGAQWHGVICHMGDTGQQPISPGLIPCAAHTCQDQAPDWGQSAPHPGVSRGVTINRGAGQMRCLGRHDTPPRVALACAPMPIVPEVPQGGTPVARHPRQPGTDRLLVHVDDASRCAYGLAFRSCPHRGLKNRRLGL